MLDSRKYYDSLMVALEWLTTKGGFSSSSNCSWSLRQEYTNRPAMLEIRHDGSVLFTVQYSDKLPVVLIPARFAATFDGKNLQLFQMLSSPELVATASLNGEAGQFHFNEIKSWMVHKKAA